MRTALAIVATLLVGALSFAAEKKTLDVYLVNTLYRNETEESIKSVSGPFKSLLEEQADVVAEVHLGGTAEKLAEQLNAGKAQFGAFNGFEYARVRGKYPELKPLMMAVNQQPFSRAVLVVRQDDKVADAAALRGKTVAIPVICREHCMMFLQSRLLGDEADLMTFFKKVAKPQTAHDALDDLAEGLVQAALVEDVDLEAFRKAYPKTGAKLRVLKESEKFPCAVIVYKQGAVAADTLTKIRDGMIAAKKTERGRKLLDLCRITGFEAIPADYEQALTDILKAYPGKR